MSYINKTSKTNGLLVEWVMELETLHIACLDKFVPPIINLIRGIETCNDQFFYTYGDIGKFPYEKKQDSIHVFKKKNKLFSFLARYIPLLIRMYKAEKIILHGLFDIYLIILLALNPWLLKKCYWLVWGGDLYSYENEIKKLTIKKRISEFFRRIVIKRIGYIVTYVDGDYELAKKWYRTKAEYIECFMYLSNIPPRYEYKEKENKTITIQVGNSADPSNNHFEILESLAKYKNIIKVYIPLSYGDIENRKKVKDYAESIFNGNARTITYFLPYMEYVDLLNEVDIAVFNHNRQQAMGNTIMLLGLGKTVFIKGSTTQWDLLTQKYGLVLKDTRELNISLLSGEDREKNIRLVHEIFTVDKLVKQYQYFL